MFGRNKIALVVGEFLGTAVLASTVLTMAGRTTFPFFGAMAAGTTLGIMVLAIGRVTGAHINPAVTVGLWTMRRVETLKALVMIASQMLGGYAAWMLSEYLLNQELRHTANWGVDWRILVAEAVGTLVFGFGIASAVTQGFKGLKQAATIGGSLTIGVLVASLGSNGILNPAVAVGINSWSWAYAVGPLLGAVIGMNLYGMFFSPIPAADKSKSAVAAAPQKTVAKKGTRKSSVAVATTSKKSVKKTAKKTTKKRKA